MFNFIRKRLDKKGFTLVELLVVIAVLGIIAGISIPRMSGVTDSFKIRADEETGRNLARQVQIRVQTNVTKVPATDTMALIALATGSGNNLGEAFTETPQYSTEFSESDRTKRKFLIILTPTEIVVFNSPATVTTATLTPTDSREVFRMDHGGVIE